MLIPSFGGFRIYALPDLYKFFFGYCDVCHRKTYQILGYSNFVLMFYHGMRFLESHRDSAASVISCNSESLKNCLFTQGGQHIHRD